MIFSQSVTSDQSRLLLLGSGSSNPKYQTYYESFVVGKSDWFKKWQPYTQALSLIHNLQAYQVW